MIDATEMPKYDGMEYEELAVAAQYMWLENAKLRKKLEMLQDGYGSMSREHSQTIAELSDAHFEIDRLKAENTRLRELAKAAWGCVNRHVSCDECRMVCCGCTLQSVMCELGIEVDA